MGTLIQGPNALDVIEDAYRAWPQVRPADEDVCGWYEDFLRRVPARKEALRKPLDREDRARYEIVLRNILSLFGKGIHESLQRTMGDYLEVTDGKFATSKLSEEDQRRKSELRNENNEAERGFAVIKAYKRLYPTMSLHNITAISHATIQGTYQMPFEVEEGQDGGALYDADPRLREAVSECCSVRLASAGVVTKMVRAKRAGDLQRAKRIKKEAQERLKEEERQKARARLQKLNATASVTPV